MDVEQLKKDIDGAKRVGKLGYDPYNNECVYNKYGMIFPFNNEGINLYYEKFNFDGSILSVASSGDHMLHAILKGASDITLFDINRLTKYYCMLKLAAVKTLSYEEFWWYFVTKPKINLNDKKLYSKIRDALSCEDRYFWDEIIKEGITTKNFYISPINYAFDNNSYYDKDTYYELKNKAFTFETPQFLETDIFDLSNKLKPNEKFSSMFLSNISDYVDSLRFENLLSNCLKKYLLEEGLIQTEYFTDYDDLGLKMIESESTMIVKKMD